MCTPLHPLHPRPVNSPPASPCPSPTRVKQGEKEEGNGLRIGGSISAPRPPDRRPPPPSKLHASRQIWKHTSSWEFWDPFKIFGGRYFVFRLLNPNSTKLTLSCAAVVQDWEENIGLELSGFARLGNHRDPHPIGEEIICVESRGRRMRYRSWSEEAHWNSSQFSENSLGPLQREQLIMLGNKSMSH